MTTYAQLQDDVTAFSARSDLTARVPTFIRLAESKIRRKVRALEMEVDAILVIPDTGEVDLPERFLGFKSVALQISNSLSDDAELTYMSPDRFKELRLQRVSSQSIVPDNYYTIESGKLKVQPAPGPGDTLSVNASYLQSFESLVNADDTNWLLINHFDIYLYATLAYLWQFVLNERARDEHNLMFNTAVEELHKSERRKRRSGPYIRRPRGPTP